MTSATAQRLIDRFVRAVASKDPDRIQKARAAVAAHAAKDQVPEETKEVLHSYLGLMIVEPEKVRSTTPRDLKGKPFNVGELAFLRAGGLKVGVRASGRAKMVKGPNYDSEEYRRLSEAVERAGLAVVMDGWSPPENADEPVPMPSEPEPEPEPEPVVVEETVTLPPLPPLPPTTRRIVGITIRDLEFD